MIYSQPLPHCPSSNCAWHHLRICFSSTSQLCLPSTCTRWTDVLSTLPFVSYRSTVACPTMSGSDSFPRRAKNAVPGESTNTCPTLADVNVCPRFMSCGRRMSSCEPVHYTAFLLSVSGFILRANPHGDDHSSPHSGKLDNAFGGCPGIEAVCLAVQTHPFAYSGMPNDRISCIINGHSLFDADVQ